MRCPKVTPRVRQAVLSGAQRPRRHWEGPGRVEGTLVPAVGHLQRGPGHLSWRQCRHAWSATLPEHVSKTTRVEQP